LGSFTPSGRQRRLQIGRGILSPASFNLTVVVSPAVV